MFDFDVRSGCEADSGRREPLVDIQGTLALTLGEEFSQPLSRVHVRPAVVCEPFCSLADACRLMADRKVGTALVASLGVLLGTISESDLVRALLSSGTHERNGAVWKLMAPGPETLLESDSVAYAIRKLGMLGVRAMPIVRAGGAPFGLLEADDLVAWISGRMAHAPSGPARNG
jgi:CBS domain-containing protein